LKAIMFDPLKAAREELAGLNDVARVLLQRERICEEALGKAEQELNAIRKIAGYVRISMETIRARITKMEKELE
jgi:hypothetical protein